MAASSLDYLLRRRAYKPQGFKVSLSFWKGLCFYGHGSLLFISSLTFPFLFPPPLLPCSVSSPIGSVCSIRIPCLPHCVPQTKPHSTARSDGLSLFWHSTLSPTLPQFPGSNFHLCPVQHFLTVDPLGSLPHVADFPLHQSQIVYLSALTQEEQGARRDRIAII